MDTEKRQHPVRNLWETSVCIVKLKKETKKKKKRYWEKVIYVFIKNIGNETNNKTIY